MYHYLETIVHINIFSIVLGNAATVFFSVSQEIICSLHQQKVRGREGCTYSGLDQALAAFLQLLAGWAESTFKTDACKIWSFIKLTDFFKLTSTNFRFNKLKIHDVGSRNRDEGHEIG